MNITDTTDKIEMLLSSFKSSINSESLYSFLPSSEKVWTISFAAEREKLNQALFPIYSEPKSKEKALKVSQTQALGFTIYPSRIFEVVFERETIDNDSIVLGLTDENVDLEILTILGGGVKGSYINSLPLGNTLIYSLSELGRFDGTPTMAEKITIINVPASLGKTEKQIEKLLEKYIGSGIKTAIRLY